MKALIWLLFGGIAFAQYSPPSGGGGGSGLPTGCTGSNGTITCTGSFIAGSGSSATGGVDMTGKTSGAKSTVQVDDNNTATIVNLPDDTTSGLYMTTSTTKNPAAGCAHYSGTGTQTTSTGADCGGAGGSGAMTLISDQVVGSAVATVTFSSIPGTYKHLLLFIDAACSAAIVEDHFYIQANADTATNYWTQYNVTVGTSSFVGTFNGATPDFGGLSCASTLAGSSTSGSVMFSNYVGTTFLKKAVLQAGEGDAASLSSSYLAQNHWAWFWNSTTAITQLVLGVVGGSNFITGSRFSLYGIS